MALKVEGDKVIILPREAVPEEAEVVRKIFREYKNGKGCYDIARALNRQNIPSKQGKTWMNSTISRMIRNPFYCGKVRTNYCMSEHKTTPKQRRNPESEWVLTQGKHEPIITEASWKEVQEIRKRRQRKSRAIGSPLLLSGLVKCGFCGWSMVIDGPAERGYYKCGNYRSTGNCQRNSYRAKHLERDVVAYVFSVMRDLCSYKKVQELQREDRSKDVRADIKRMEKALAGLLAQKRKLFELFETNEIPKEELLDRREELQEREANLRKSLDEKREEIEKLESKRINEGAFRKTIRNFEAKFKKGDRAKQKADLAAVIESISIKDKQFKVNFRYSPHPE